jgi:osmotically-inducible protein OsmY
MNVSLKRRNWAIFVWVVSLICEGGGFASPAAAQTTASHKVSRSNTNAASTAQDQAAANAELRKRVMDALHADPYFNDRHVDISVEKGVVVLRGIVFSEWDLRDALRIAMKAAGDRPVIDELAIEEGGR